MADSKGGGLKGLDVLMAMGPPPKAKMGPSRESMGQADESLDPDMDADEDAQAPDELLVDAAQDVLGALHDRDAEGMAVALKAFVSMC